MTEELAMPIAPLAVSPAGGATRVTAPTVNLLSLSAPTSSVGRTDGVVAAQLIGALAWWRFESFTERPVQVYFDAMRSTAPDGSHVVVVLLDKDGETIGDSRYGTDPADGEVPMGAVLSPSLRLFDVVYIAIGQELGDPGNPGEPVDMTYRLRVSDHSPLTDWIDLPDRARTSLEPIGTLGNDAPSFVPGAPEFVPDPEMPYVPPYLYSAGFADPGLVWNGGAIVFNNKLSRLGPPPPQGYDGGGPYGDIFKGTGASACAQRHAMNDGKWNDEGKKWGGYWNDYCPPFLERSKTSLGQVSTNHGVAYLSMSVDNSNTIITDPDSISYQYRAPIYAFTLHDAQNELGPSAGWLMQEQMLAERNQATDYTSEIVWEQDNCEILDVVVVRHEAETRVFGYDKLPPPGSGIRVAPSASWRGGASRVPKPGELKWGPYVESLAGTPNAQYYYDIFCYGSSAGPESMPRVGQAVFDSLHELPSTPVGDWRDAYAFEEDRKTITYDSGGGEHIRYHAPGLVYAVTPDGYDQFAIDPSNTPQGQGYTLEIFIQGMYVSFEMAVRPSRFLLRDRPVIPRVAPLTAEFTFTSDASGRKVTFDGSPSQAGNYPIIWYEWDFDEHYTVEPPVQPTDGQILDHMFYSFGPFQVTLTVFDGNGDHASVTHEVDLRSLAIDGDFVNDRNAFSGAT